MGNVVLFSMLYPETRVIGTNNLSTFKPWYYSNTLEPYNIGKIKHVTGDVFVATVSKGTSGSVWITYDQGHHFEKVMRCGTPGALARGQDGMMFLTAGGNVYRSPNGKNWTMVSGAPNILAYACCTGGLIFGHDSVRVWKSIDNGLHWEVVFDCRAYGFGGIPNNAIAASDSGFKVMISCGPKLYMSMNKGDSWTLKASWDNWNVPRELHYLGGLTWVLKMRHIAEDLGSIQISTNDGSAWVKKFNQYVIHDHQIEYIPGLNLLICGHTRYNVGSGTSLASYVPSIMVSWNRGSSFTEYVFDDQQRFFSVLAIAGTYCVNIIDDKRCKQYNMDVLLRKMRAKTFSSNLTLRAKPTKSIDTNVILQRSKELSFDFNALLQKQRTGSFNVNALMRKTIASGVGMDVITVQRNHLNYITNMLIQNEKHTVIDIDALLRKNVSKGYGMRLFITDSHFDAIKTEMARSVPQAFNIESPPICHKLLADIQVNRGGETNE